MNKKTKSWLWVLAIIIAVIIVISIILSSNGVLFSPTIARPSQDTCRDTDGGWNVQLQGTVGGYQRGRQYTHTDYCLTNGSTLNEYYCQNTTWREGGYNCPYGCSNGACANATQLPDLMISAVIPNPAHNVMTLVRNIGTASTVRTTFLGINLTRVGNNSINSFVLVVPILAPGGIAVLNTTSVIPGNYSYFGYIDSSNYIQESNESNNWYSTIITIP